MKFSEGYIKLMKEAVKVKESVVVSDILSPKKENKLPYAYPCENYLDKILSNVLVRKALRKFTDDKCKNKIEEICKDCLVVYEKSFPRLNYVLNYCYKELGVNKYPKVYVTDKLTGVNALSIGSDDNPIVLISHQAVAVLTEEELKFMIGHEIGHLLQNNLECHTLKGMLDNVNDKSEIIGPMISEIIEVPLNQWYRCAEFTADRAGLICCKDINTVKKLFGRYGMKENNSSIENFYELAHTHPLLEKRLKELISYYENISEGEDRYTILKSSY